MKREWAQFIVIVILSVMVVAGTYMAGARYLRGMAWVNGEPVTFVELNGLRLP